MINFNINLISNIKGLSITSPTSSAGYQGGKSVYSSSSESPHSSLEDSTQILSDRVKKNGKYKILSAEEHKKYQAEVKVLLESKIPLTEAQQIRLLTIRWKDALGCFQSKKDQVTTLESELITLKQQSEEKTKQLESRINELKERILDKDEKLSAAEKETQRYKNKEEVTYRSYRDIKKQEEDTYQDYRKIKKEKEQVCHKFEDLEKKYKDLEKQHKTLKRARDEKEEGECGEPASKKQRLEQGDAKHVKPTVSADILLKVQEEFADWKAQNTKLQQELADVKASYDKSQSVAYAWELRTKELEKEKTSLQTKMEVLEKENSSGQASVKKLKEQKSKIKEDSENTEKENAKFRKQIEELKNQNAQLQQKLKEKEQSTQTSEAEKNKLISEIASLKADKLQLEKNVAETKPKIEKLTQQSEDYQKKFMESEEHHRLELGVIKQTQQIQERKLEDALKQNQQLMQQNNFLNVQLQERQQRCVKLNHCVSAIAQAAQTALLDQQQGPQQ